GVRRRLRRRLQRARAGRSPLHDPPREDPHDRGWARRVRCRPRGRLRRHGHALRGRSRFRRRARRDQAEPRDLVATGARGARQASPAGMAAGAHVRDRQGGQVTRIRVLFAALAVALCVPAAGIGSGNGLPTTIGKGEGQLNLVAWEGYTQKQWVAPFTKATGCKVNKKYAGSSDEMVTLMRSGGGSQYDMVSASGDASLRLIYGKDVQPVNVNLIPDWKSFAPQLRSPAHNTIGGQHYGVSLQWGPNTLLYNTTKVKPAPTSWAAIYDAKYKGKVTVPDNPIQIADAALYLSKSKPSLGITDPYELNQKQFDAAVSLLKKQRPLIKKYWALASDEIDLFKNGDTVIGATWPYQTN